jgi:DNA-binding transcriptional ArsR family regulator
MRRDPLDAAFRALADRTRRGVVDLLRERDHRAGELSASLGVSAPALSRHLRVLRGSGLVEELDDAADARVSVYRLRREPFAQLRGWVDHVESLWQDQLTAFADHVDRTRGASAKGRKP